MRKIFIISSIILIISIIRLTDAVFKTVIKYEADSITRSNEEYSLVNESLSTYLTKIDQEITLQQLKKELANESEYYLVLERKTTKAWLKVEDKVMREMDFTIWLVPELGDRTYLPSGSLQILAKQESTNFYIPDFYYELLGDSAPKDSVPRTIKNAFGTYVLYLSENLMIHGPFNPDLPKDLVRHNGIIFKPEDLEVIYHSLKPKARIVFY